MFGFRGFVFLLSLFVFMAMGKMAVSQNLPAAPPDPPKNWYQLDPDSSGYMGISLDKAYQLVKGKKSKTVLVAIIDSGVDTLQKDLQGILWVNPKEKPGKGIDHDHNGYAGDIHGWNFLGGKNGKCDFNETSEEIREYNRLKNKYADTVALKTADTAGYAYWLKVKTLRDSGFKKAKAELVYLQPEMNALMVSNGYIKQTLNLQANATFGLNDLDSLKSRNDTINRAKYVWQLLFRQQGVSSTNAEVLKDLGEYIQKLTNIVNPDLTARKDIVGDDPDVNDGKSYGNNQLKYPDAWHGTGIAGIIGAKRGNGYGIDGIADNVRMMVIKAGPIGDVYDKDMANAIRYAVDNGARIITATMTKNISPHRDWVDEAYRYAAKKDVLIIQAAGNDNLDLDSVPQYPKAPQGVGNVIVVGASGLKKDNKLAADFSNYGQKTVDIFAPGIKVTSINMDGEFNTQDGTSFSAPVVAGIATLLLEYYPKLSAVELKQVILQSAASLKGLMVSKPGTKQQVVFSSLSTSGGVINAYRAMEMAGKM